MPTSLKVQTEGEKLLNVKTEAFKFQFSHVCVDGTCGEGEADDPESLEQTHLQVNTSH